MGTVKDTLAGGGIVTTRGRKPKKVEPEVVIEAKEKKEVIYASERVNPMKEKQEYVALPTGVVKVIALHDYVGMLDVIYEGEVFLLPERRYKSLQARGFVEAYEGEKPVINKR